MLLLMLGCHSSEDPQTGPADGDVASLDVSPRSAVLAPGQHLTLTATPRTGAGNPLPGKEVTWQTEAPAVATVSSTGVVQGQGLGSTNVIAASGGMRTSVAIEVTETPATRTGFYVSPLGTANATGTASAPWDLATALAHPAAVHAGDTIWIRNGTYQGCFIGKLSGSAANPIIVRVYPFEHAVLDGAGCNGTPLTLQGQYTWYWGLEVTTSTPGVGLANNIDVFGQELKLINLVVHDAAGSGVGMWSPGAGGELYGSIIYNNGTKDNLDHGVYTQNATGTKKLTDNIIFHQWAFGIHAYGSEEASLAGFDLEGNIVFDNGTIGEINGAPNILVGGGAPASRVTVHDNFAYASDNGSTNVRLGYEAVNLDADVRGNTIIGGSPALLFQSWTTATVNHNYLLSSQELLNLAGSVGTYAWNDNTYVRDPGARAWGFRGIVLAFSDWQQASELGANDAATATAPSDPLVVVRPNRYEAGRAQIAIYNPSGAAEVAVDVSQVLQVGDDFEVRNAQTFFAPPVVTGRYTGGPLTLPMAPVEAVTPIGRATNRPPVSGPRFQAFVLLSPR